MLKVYSVLLIMFLSIPLSHAGNKIKVYCDKGWDLSADNNTFTCKKTFSKGINRKKAHDVVCPAGFHLNPISGSKKDECKAIIGQKRAKPTCYAPLAEGIVTYEINSSGQDYCSEKKRKVTEYKRPSVKDM